MISRIWNAIKKHPGRLAVVASMLLAVANAVLVATALIRQRSAADLAVQVENLEFSLEQLQQVDRERLMELEAEADAAEGELDRLENAFPELGEQFDLYRQAFALAGASNVEIASVETGESSIHQTPVGYLSKTDYTVKGLGGYSDCLALMEQLETAGLQTLALDQLHLDPIHCEFIVVLASSVPAAEVDPVEVLGDG